MYAKTVGVRKKEDLFPFARSRGTPCLKGQGSIHKSQFDDQNISVSRKASRTAVQEAACIVGNQISLDQGSLEVAQIAHFCVKKDLNQSGSY
jgi:hypothetical protein